MPVWTCPNGECPFDKQLKSGQRCPLCGKEAQAFNFNEFGTLLKEKWRYKKSVQKAKERGQIARRMKFCPKCGSSDINLLAFYRPSVWKCLSCGYEGALVLEHNKPPEKNRK
jgi:ribosomal protein S27AE